MSLEIERKFLVASDAWRTLAGRSTAMKQGYLSGEGGKASTRVRIEGERANLNIKAAVVGRARAEYQYDIPLREAEELLATLCVGVLEKTRHHVAQGELTWEIDVFEGANAGLVVAELELPSVEHPFRRPAWLGREVTDDRRYYNQHLALHPYSTWPERLSR